MRQQGARRGGNGARAGANGARAGAAVGGLGQERGGGGACLGFSVGPVRGRARRGGEEGEARSAVLYWGSLTVPRARRPVLGAAGSLGMVLGNGTCAHPTLLVHRLLAEPGPCRPGLRTAPSPWVELGSTQGVVWCDVVCRRRCYQKAKGRDVYPRVKVNGLGCVCCVRAVRKCVGLGRGRGSRGDLVSSPLATALIPGAPAALFPFCLLVQAQLLQRPRHRAARAQAGLQQCGTRLGVGVPDPYGLLHGVAEELRAQRVGPRTLQVGQLHGGGPQGCRPLLQHSRFPQLVTHWGRPWPHLLVEPRCEAPAGWPPLVRLS